MNKEKALQEALDRYIQNKKEIEMASKVAKKIEPLLPKGWTTEWEAYWLRISSGEWHGERKIDAMEFKTVCKIVKRITKDDFDITTRVDNEDISFFKGAGSIEVGTGYLLIEIFLYSPKHTCEITWTEETKKVAKVSDGCLGIG